MKRFKQIVTILFVLLLFPHQMYIRATESAREEAINFEIEKLRKQVNDQPGTYPLTFTYETNEGKVIEETVMMTLTGTNTITDEVFGINSEDAVVSKNQVYKMTDEQWIKLARASAWEKTTNSPVKISAVDTSNIKNTPNMSYPITFSLANGLSTTSKITVEETAVVFVNKTDIMNRFPTIKIVSDIVIPLIAFLFSLPTIFNFIQYIQVLLLERKIKKIFFND